MAIKKISEFPDLASELAAGDDVLVERGAGGFKKDGAGFVVTTGAQSIAGVKTFTDSPIVPTPTTSTQTANKTYVDTLVNPALRILDAQNVAIDPAGFNGSTGWTVSSATVTSESTTLTGYDSEIKVVTAGAGDAYQTNPLPANLQSVWVEVEFEGYVQTGTPVISFKDQSGGALTHYGALAASGKFKYAGRVLTTSATSLRVVITGSGAIDLRMTNIYIGRPRSVFPIKVQGIKTSNQALTANTTNITFTETVDKYALYDGTTFTAPFTGYYSVILGPASTGPSAGFIVAYVNASASNNFSVAWASAMATTGIFRILLNRNDALTFRGTLTQNYTVNATNGSMLEITYQGEF